MARISTNQQRAEAFNAAHVPEKHLHLCSQVIRYNLFQPRSGPPACLAAAYKSVGAMMSLTSGRMIREKGNREILQHILVNVLWDLLNCQWGKIWFLWKRRPDIRTERILMLPNGLILLGSCIVFYTCLQWIFFIWRWPFVVSVCVASFQ